MTAAPPPSGSFLQTLPLKGELSAKPTEGEETAGVGVF